MTIEKSKKIIDLENIIRNKNPTLLKFLPRFILNYIRKIIHEDGMNEFLHLHGEKTEFEFIEAVLNYFNIQINIVGEENIPITGGVIFASNHPLGGLDALALLKTISKKRTDLKFLVNDILMQLSNLKGLFVPINKHGKNSSNMLEEIDKVYSSEQGILIFPAGLVSRKQGGIIKDLEWKKSFITKAKKYQKNIVPVYIAAENSRFFYNLSNWRKKLGMKANIEMVYLVDEMYKQRNQTITLIFGKAISYQTFDKTLTDQQWAEKVKEIVYEMKN